MSKLETHCSNAHQWHLPSVMWLARAGCLQRDNIAILDGQTKGRIGRVAARHPPAMCIEIGAAARSHRTRLLS